MSKKHKLSFFQLLFPLLLALPFPFTLMNCARESAPTGGPVDTIAPYAVFEKPENNSQNCNPQKIVVKFNEYIALDNIEDNCMISPVMEEKPEITVKKKKMIIDLSKQKLQPGTTYSFNFNNAIKDLTEDNLTSQYLYAFSSGTGIDTMKLAGTVSYAKDGKIPEHAYILLYDDLSDTAFQTQKPRYITQISKKGEFAFSNIEAKSYKIYALEDSDKDFTFNQASEKIAFLDTIFNPTAERYIDTIWFSHNDTIRFEEYDDSIQITQVKDSFNLVGKTRWSDQDVKLTIFENEVWNQEILTNKRLSTYALACKLAAKNNFPTAISTIPEGQIQKEEIGNDSLIIWLNDTILQKCDSAKILISYTKNHNNPKIITDTIAMEIAKDLPERLKCSSSTEKNNKIYPGDTLIITVSRLLSNFDLQKIKLYEECDTSKTKCDELLALSDYHFRPKYHYDGQRILKHKESNDRFALYFSKPINPKDIKITLDGLPNVTDWYYAECDEKSNSILFWIKPTTDALKLKNQAITVEYKDLDGKIVKTNFNSKKDVPVQKMYKTPTSNKKLLLQIAENQKTTIKTNEPIRIYCNNPIHTITDSLFSLVAADDSLETSIITNVSLSKGSSRIIEISHSASEGKSYNFEIRKGALIDTFGSINRELFHELQTETIDHFYAHEVPCSISKQNDSERSFAITANWNINSNYKLVIPDSTFTDIYNDANDSVAFAFQCPKKDEVGNLLVKNTLGFPSDKLVFFLESENAKEPQTFIGSKLPEGIRFENLPAGSYMLYSIVDENANNKWDSGCIEIKRQPEKIYFFKEKVTIKAEWENSLFWEEF